MFPQSTFDPVAPRPMPPAEACMFYHAIDFPDGGAVSGAWDIRDRFHAYIGDYPIAGKTVLDVGTASGFLAFSAERAGATVTALEGLHASEYDQIHFAGLPFHEDRAAHDAAMETWFETLKNGFWHGWHRTNSRAEMVYAPLVALPYWKRRFDVVIAGAILEHLADPVSVIGALARLANEAVIIAFTPVADEDRQFMATANDWDDPRYNYTWWTLSRGLYRRVFANVGFDIEITEARAVSGGVEHARPTIVARRK